MEATPDFCWRAASIPDTTDWSDFDLIISHLNSSRKRALELGAKAVEHFYPGFPAFLANQVKDQNKLWDVVFSGQATAMHQQRNRFLNQLFQAATQKQFMNLNHRII
jgi:hypothetical protein